MKPGANRDAYIAAVTVGAIVCLILLALASTAQAKYSTLTLNEVASIYAQRPVEAWCYSFDEEDAPAAVGAWGYVLVPLAQQTEMHLDNKVCIGALAVNQKNVPAWQRAIGVATLVHESYHLRKWGAAGNEAKVECKAIRHWKDAARMLGATEETVAELWPYALAEHYELANYLDVWNQTRPYFDPSCDVPPLFIEEEPDA